MGRALITNNIHGCLEAVEDGTTGFLCEKQNKESLYNEIEKFILMTSGEREKMGQYGRIKMENEFDKMMVVAKTMEEIGFN